MNGSKNHFFSSQAITETMPTEEPDPREVQQQQQMMQMNQAMMAAMFAPRPPPKNPTPAPMDIAQIMAAAQAHVQVHTDMSCHSCAMSHVEMHIFWVVPRVLSHKYVYSSFWAKFLYDSVLDNMQPYILAGDILCIYCFIRNSNYRCVDI